MKKAAGPYKAEFVFERGGLLFVGVYTAYNAVCLLGIYFSIELGVWMIVVPYAVLTNWLLYVATGFQPMEVYRLLWTRFFGVEVKASLSEPAHQRLRRGDFGRYVITAEPITEIDKYLMPRRPVRYIVRFYSRSAAVRFRLWLPDSAL